MIIVSIVTHNNSTIIKEAILSIIRYTEGVEYKIVVHDNASTDNTVDAVQSIKDEHIEVIDSKTNCGFGYGHNCVIKKYEAQYYLIYNPDVFLKSNMIGELYEYMEGEKDVGLTTPKVIYPTGEIQYLCKENPTVFDLFSRRFLPSFFKKYLNKRQYYYEMRSTGYDKEFDIPYATGAFMFFRGTILKRVNGFDENIFMYLEDADITRRVNEISRSIFYPYDSIVHMWGRGSHRSIKLTLVNVKSAIYYFNKWGWKFF